MTEKPTKQEIACPLCDAFFYDVLYEPTKMVDDPIKLYGATSGIQGTQRLVKCKECGLIYENPRYPETVILEGYSAYHEPVHDSQYTMRVESFYRALCSVKNKIPKSPAKVLDVGTASGAFLEAAEKFGYKAVGLEPSAFMVQKGRQRGFDIVQGTLEQNEFAADSFDMICLWDVLEHMPNPKKDLMNIHKLLKPEGILLINYPDIGTWMAKISGRRFWWLLSVHLVHFNRHTITEICKKMGYLVFHFQPYWQVLQFGYLQGMAVHFGLPMSRLIKTLTPNFIQQIPIPYYASQTLALAKKST